jgi:hypothetical protein
VQKARYSTATELLVTIVFVEADEYNRRINILRRMHPTANVQAYESFLVGPQGRSQLPPPPTVADLFASDEAYQRLPSPMERACHISRHLATVFQSLRSSAQLPTNQELAIDYVLFEANWFANKSIVLTDVRTMSSTLPFCR